MFTFLNKQQNTVCKRRSIQAVKLDVEIRFITTAVLIGSEPFPFCKSRFTIYLMETEHWISLCLCLSSLHGVCHLYYLIYCNYKYIHSSYTLSSFPDNLPPSSFPDPPKFCKTSNQILKGKKHTNSLVF